MRTRLCIASAAAITIALCGVAHGDKFLDESSPCCDQPSICDEACRCSNESCECCDCWCDGQRILGMLPSDHCFDRFVSPLSNPFFFEDPRSLTEVRGIFIDNGMPNTIAGGDVHVWAAQYRGRLTHRMSVIVPRVGYLQVNQTANVHTGFPSAPVGLKYNFLRDVDRQLLVSAGLTYFIPPNINGFPPTGSGDFHFFLTGGKEIFGRGHWLSATGFRIPTNNNWGTQMWYWSNQWDYEVVNHWYGLFGVNWFHWMRNSNNNFTGPIGGLDLINLPAGGVAGSDVVTGMVGVKWKPSGNVEVGTGYEFPFTQNGDILRNRLYVDFILRY